jgi:uncharacterized membrane protein
MIVIVGLLILIAAAGVAVAGVAANTGTTHPAGDAFVIFGQSVTGLSVGQVFLFGIIVGVVGMLALAMLLGTFNQRLASRGSRRALKGSRSESAALRLDRERLTQQLDDERARLTQPSRVESASATDASPAVPDSTSTARAPAPAERSGIWHRIGHRADR